MWREVRVAKYCLEHTDWQLMRVERCFYVPKKHFKIRVVNHKVATPVVIFQQLQRPHHGRQLRSGQAMSLTTMLRYHMQEQGL